MITRPPKSGPPSPFADAYDALGRDGAEADVEKYLGAQAEILPGNDGVWSTFYTLRTRST